MDGWRTIVPITKITSSKIVQYSYCLDSVAKPKEREVQNGNLTRGDYNGFLSTKTKSQLREKLCNWLLAGRIFRKSAQRKAKVTAPYYTFATLTLPAKQAHSDNELKRQALNHLIILLQRRYKVVNYFWRAEPQGNGNLHFHLILDRYIPNASLQRHWNGCLSPLGYIERFRRVHGHSQPPSTHVVKLTGKDSAVKYLSKYLSKYENRRKIGGRLWGCSDAVKAFASPVMETTDLHSALVETLSRNKDNFSVKTPFFGAVFGDVYGECQKKHPELWKQISESLVTNYVRCYSFDEPPNIVVEPVQTPTLKTVTKAYQSRINYCYPSI